MMYKINEIQISYRERQGVLNSESLPDSKGTAKLLFDDWDKGTIGLYESFKVICLNSSNKIKGILPLSSGGVTGTLVDMRILFGSILKSLSIGIILAHNHPSGRLKPSEADLKLTWKIQEAANFFDIDLIDHFIIIPNGDYFSFAENAIL